MADKEKATPVTPDEIDDIRVTLDLDEGEVECKILTIFDVNEQDYIALMPLNPDGSDPDEGMKCSMMTTSMHSKTKSNFFKPASNTRCRFFTALYRLL